MTTQALPDAAFVRSMLEYDKDTGLLTHRVGRGRVRAGSEAGCVNTQGYVVVGIAGKLFPAHRVAWLIVTGAWPSQMIDHIDGDRSNNRWINLREADKTLNAENMKGPRKDNKSGYLGVYRCRNRWQACINIRGKRYIIGNYNTAEEASEAYLDCKRLFHEGSTL